jgi:hypothetical protein
MLLLLLLLFSIVIKVAIFKISNFNSNLQKNMSIMYVLLHALLQKSLPFASGRGTYE